MLAYLFWHQPRSSVETARYEDRLRAFHTQLREPSASFRVTPLPFIAADGYEDWYLVADWSELGPLNAMAVSGDRRPSHDSVAEFTGRAWGGLYALVRGNPEPPQNVRWVNKPVGVRSRAFRDSLSAPTLWQRQMVLGPAPEFCVVQDAASRQRESSARTEIYPAFAPTD